LCSYFDKHKVIANPKQFEIHTTKKKLFHVETLGRGLQTKKRHSLSLTKSFLSEVMPYPISSCLGNHRFFLGYLVLSHPSRSRDFISEDEDDPSYIYGFPLHIWFDKTCGYTFRKDDQADGLSFQHYFLPPTHLHEFYFMIDYIHVYTHDYYVFKLSFLYYMIKSKGRYFDEVTNWLHSLYDFT
jgi:hypothetical protein